MPLNNKTALYLLAGSVWVLGAAACSDSDSPSEGSGAAGSAGSSGGTNSSGGKGGSTGGTSSSGGKGGGTSSGGGPGTGGSKAGSSNAGTGGSEETGGSAGAPDGNAGEGPGGTGAGGDDGTGEGGGGGGEEPDPNAPVLQYLFDEGEGTVVGDDSGRGLDATLTDASAWSNDGRTGSALSLSGGATPTQFVEMPSGVFTGMNEATIATWVKLDTNPALAPHFSISAIKAPAPTRVSCT